MKIGILSRSANIYSTKCLFDAAVRRGHEVVVIDHLRCYMDINSTNPKVYYKGEELIFDAVIPRIGSSTTFYGTAILRQFEINGVYTVNPSLAISQSRDKLRAHQLLSQEKIGIPTTAFSYFANNVEELIKIVGGSPLILKLLEGTQGKGVILADTDKSAKAVVEAFGGLETFFLVQEFIKESDGADIRCFVVGDQVVASMKRQGAEGEFRSNLHRGGSGMAVELTEEERKTAISAARIMGLGVAGVDLVRSKRGPLILEINSSPGLEGIQAVTHKDIADMIIDFVEKNSLNKV